MGLAISRPTVGSRHGDLQSEVSIGCVSHHPRRAAGGVDLHTRPNPADNDARG